MFVTYLIPLRKKVSPFLSHRTFSCDKSSLLKAGRCLRDWNSQYQFAPVYTTDDICGHTELLPNFSPSHLYVYKERDEVLGTLGVWNQQSYKQTIVTDYSVKMATIKPFYNGVARPRGFPILPDIGGSIRFVYASFLSVRDDNPEVFTSLIEKARFEWSGRGHDYLVVGLSDENKLSAVVRRLAARELKSRVYLVHWPEDKVFLPQAGTIHLEIATL
jgi:hypothetical protein